MADIAGGGAAAPKPNAAADELELLPLAAAAAAAAVAHVSAGLDPARGIAAIFTQAHIPVELHEAKKKKKRGLMTKLTHT
jgi:hypothetical protein